MAVVYKNGEPIVIDDADLQAYLADGCVSEETGWGLRLHEVSEAEAAEVNNPETLERRFISLREIRDGLLAQTDYLLASDYPATEETLAKVKAYRQALRDLPQMEGAPWDGGGPLTPWPEKDF